MKKESPDPLSAAIGMIQQSNPCLQENRDGAEIVDIIEFCESPTYLNLPRNGLTLYTSQRVILKTFYRGDIGNENVQLDEGEWKWLHDNETDETLDNETYEKNVKDVIKKIMEQEKTGRKFTQLQLVLGRRAGKTLLASIITAYEAYKLLAINGGDPHGYYHLPKGDEISIINVALSQEQAGVLFSAIQSRIRDSKFFQPFIASQASDEIRFFTQKDLESIKNKKQTLRGKGSIILKCGHSNPDSLAGRSAILLLFDEIAFFDETGKVTGKYFFNRLKPSLSRFYKEKAAKIVQISSPNTRMGIFYETYEQSKDDPTTLSFQLPTWCVNDEVSYELEEMQRDRVANPEMFRIEYGAQWSTSGTIGNFFEEGLISRCIRGDLQPHIRPDPRFNYYMHVDPSKGGNNYSAVLVAKERYTDQMGKRRNRVYLANAWIWRPVPGIGLQFQLIDKDVIGICNLFRPMLVTYDDYHSMHSIQSLRSHGVNTRQVPYNRNVKMKIYHNLSDLMGHLPQPEILLYDDGGVSSLLIQELRYLKKKRTQRGFQLTPDKHGEVKTDDLSDCLAGAASAATEGIRMALPEPVTVYTGLI